MKAIYLVWKFKNKESVYLTSTGTFSEKRKAKIFYTEIEASIECKKHNGFISQIPIL